MALGERLSSAAKILFEGTVVERAFKPLDTEEKISIQGYPSRPRDFDLYNGAVYLGVLARRSRLKKAMDALDYRDADGAYSETGVLAVLQQAALRRKEGQKIKVILVGGLRELCNDGEAPILSFDEQKDRLVALSRTHLDLTEKDFEFVNMVDEHAKLFARSTDVKYPLAYDPAPISVKNASPLDAVFAEAPGPNEWNSYRIAYDLYQAVKADFIFSQTFKSLMPEGLPKEADDGSFSFLAGYSLFETAIHLADVIKGRSCQIGVGRQAKYNEVVIELMKGKNGSWKDLKVLHPLFERIQNETFIGVNVSKSPSPVTSGIRRTRARVRLLVEAAGAAATLGVGALGGQMIERHRQADLDAIQDARMTDILHGERCYSEDSWMGQFSDKEKVNRLKYHLPEVRDVLKVRYNIEYTDKDWETVGIPSFLDFLSQDVQIPGYNGICDFLLVYPQYVHDLTDEFVKANWSRFKSQGYEVTRPYGYMGELDFSHSLATHEWCISDLYPGLSIQEVGEFLPYNKSTDPVKISQIQEGASVYLATLDKNGCYTTSAIPKIKEDYEFTLRRWARLPYRYHNDDFYHRPSSENTDTFINGDSLSIISRFPPFVDPVDQTFYYEPVLVVDTRNGWPDRYIMARRKGEETYSTTASLEMFDVMSYLDIPWVAPNPLAPRSVQTTP